MKFKDYYKQNKRTTKKQLFKLLDAEGEEANVLAEFIAHKEMQEEYCKWCKKNKKFKKL